MCRLWGSRLMARPTPKDRQPKAAPACDGSSMIRISEEVDPETGYGLITSSCGWSKFHKRAKTRGDAAEAHAAKRHGGRALWF